MQTLAHMLAYVGAVVLTLGYTLRQRALRAEARQHGRAWAGSSGAAQPGFRTEIY